jgi:WD40 repeat protein
MDNTETYTNLRWPHEPYPGLRPFRVSPTSDEALIFYGRNGHKDEILKRLNEQRLVFVTGPSGCGKSSLVRVGVLPVLQAGLLTNAGSEWRIVSMRPGLVPVSRLATILSDLCPGAKSRIELLLSRDVSGLWMATDLVNEEVGSVAPILLLVDQFEELFRSQVSSEQVDQFVRLIVRFFERPHPDLYIIITLRTDFLDVCTKFTGLAAAINATQFLTPILGLHELIQVINRPAEDYGGIVEKPLLERLLLDMRPGAGYDPDNLALLQHALQWLWRTACVRNGLTQSPHPTSNKNVPLALDLQSYADAGGLRGILNVHADQVASRYQMGDRTVLETLFKRLAEKTPGGGYRRSPAKMSDITKVAGSPDTVLRITNDLAREDVEFLDIRNDPQRSDPLIDICHEALIRTWDRYRGWVDDEDEKLRIVRRIANDAVHWQQRGRREEDLQHGHFLHFRVKRWTELAPTKEWADRYPLSATRPERLSNIIPLIESYFEESNKLARKEEAANEELRVKEATARIRLVRDRLLGVVTLLTIIAIFFGYRYVTADQQAEELVAGSFRVLAEDALVARSDAPTALLWTLEGLKRAPGFEKIFEPLVYRSLQDLRLRKVFKSRSNVTAVSFSPDTKFFVSAHQDAKMRISSIEAGLMEEVPIPNAPLVGGGFARVRWSAHGDLIAIAGRDAVTILWACSLSSLRQAYNVCKKENSTKGREPITIPFKGRMTNAQFSPDSKTLLVQSGPSFFQGETALFDIALLQDAQESPQEPVVVVKDTTWAAAFSSDGDDLAVGGQDGNIHIFHRPNFTEGKPLKRTDAGPVNQIWSLTFSGGPTNELYSGQSDGSLLRWDINSGESALFGKQPGQVFQLLASRDGEWIASSSDNGFVMLWSTRNPNRDAIKIGPHGGPIWNFDLGGNAADWLLVPSSNSVYFWSRRGALWPTVQLSVAPKSNSSSLHVTTNPGTYSIASNDKIFHFQRPKGSGSSSVASRTADGRYFAVAQDEGSVLLYSTKNEEAPLVALRGPPRKWKAIEFDGDKVVGFSEAGDQISWPFFPNKTAMLDYAVKSIPVVNNDPMQLDEKLLCLLVSTDKSEIPSCQGAAGAPNLEGKLKRPAQTAQPIGDQH